MSLIERALAAARLRPSASRPEQYQLERRNVRNNYVDGPIAFIGGQIVKVMQAKGWPCKIHCLYRSPAEQNAAFHRGVSKARAFQSPHQYSLAVDIIHSSLGWDVPDRFWADLSAAVVVVSQRYDIALEHGHFWKFRDSAHVELKDWRKWRALWGDKSPDADQLAKCFEQLLPGVWRNRPMRYGG